MDQPTVVRPKIWLAVLNALFAAAGLGLGAWCALSIPEAAYGGMRAPAYLILWILVWFGCNRGFALWQQFAATGLPRTTLRVAKWVLPFLLPIPLIRAVESTVQARQLDIARHALAPVIAYADTQPPGRFVAEDAPAPRFATPVHFQDSPQGYTLWLLAPAVDLDGFTLSYASTTRAWKRRHNDGPDRDALADGRCILKSGAWQCAGSSDPSPAPVAD